MRTHYNAIYLSPHLDDAALSCGGQIFQQTAAGQHVLIVTVMAGSADPAHQSAYIDMLHTRWELVEDAAAERRAEDIAACAILGADYLHLAVPDCIYRFHPVTGTPLYLSDADIFGDVHPAEAHLLEDLVTRLRSLPRHDQIYAPLTVGHHVDHLLVRAAAEQAGRAGLLYYEDYPYAQKPGLLKQVFAERIRSSWQAEVLPIGDAGLRAKYDAIWAFRSQLSTFFGDRADLEQQVGEYTRQTGGERLWRRIE